MSVLMVPPWLFGRRIRQAIAVDVDPQADGEFCIGCGARRTRDQHGKVAESKEAYLLTLYGPNLHEIARKPIQRTPFCAIDWCPALSHSSRPEHRVQWAVEVTPVGCGSSCGSLLGCGGSRPPVHARVRHETDSAAQGRKSRAEARDVRATDDALLRDDLRRGWRCRETEKEGIFPVVNRSSDHRPFPLDLGSRT